MKNASVALVMNKIVGEAEAEADTQRRLELLARKRAKIFRLVRVLLAVLFLAGVGTFAAAHRQKLKTLFDSQPAATTNTPKAAAAAATKKAQQNATACNNVLSQAEK